MFLRFFLYFFFNDFRRTAGGSHRARSPLSTASWPVSARPSGRWQEIIIDGLVRVCRRGREDGGDESLSTASSALAASRLIPDRPGRSEIVGFLSNSF